MTDAITVTVFAPWKRVWRHPRQTVRDVMGNDRVRGLWLLPVASGIVQSLLQATTEDLGLRGSAAQILMFAVPVGAVWGLVQLHLASGVYYLGSKFFGRHSPYPQIRKAVSLSCSPLATVLVAWLGCSAYYGRTIFVSSGPISGDGTIVMLTKALLLLGSALAAVWSMLILALAIAEVEQVSVPKAIGLILGTLLTLVLGLGILAAILIPAIARL